MRCIECEEIELARVRDQRPTQTLPVPYAALDGFPAGRTPRDLTRRRLLQWGVAGIASIYGATGARLGRRSGSRSRPRPPTPPTRQVPRADLPRRRQRRPEHVPPERRRATTSAYVTARADHPPRPGPTTRRRAVGSEPLPGPGRRGARVRQRRSVARQRRRAATTARRPRPRHAVRRRHRRRGLGPGDHAGRRRQQVHAQPLRQLATSGSTASTTRTPRPAGSDAGSTATAPTQPAAGGLDRHGAVEGDPHGEQPVCAIVAADAGFTLNGRHVAFGRLDTTSTRRCATLAALPVGAGNAYLARSRGHVRRSPSRRTTARKSTHGDAPDAAVYPNTYAVGAAEARRRPAGGATSARAIITIHWGGFDTHATSSPRRTRSWPSSRARSPRSRPTCSTRGIEHRVATLVFSEFGRRVAENGVRRHRPRRRRPDDGDGQRRARRLRLGLAGLRAQRAGPTNNAGRAT